MTDEHYDSVLRYMATNFENPVPLNAEQIAIKANLNINAHQTASILGRLVRDGYVIRSSGATYSILAEGISFIDDGGYTQQAIERNKNEVLQRKLITTSIDSNKWSPRWAALAAGFSFISLIVSAFTYFKTDEILSPSLKQLDTTMQSQIQRLDSTYTYLKEINLSIDKLRNDSLP